MIRGAKTPLLLASGCALAFVVLLSLAYGSGIARWADGVALHGFMDLQRPLVTPVAQRIAHLADPLPYALLGSALIAVALAGRQPRHALAAAVLLGGSAISSQLLKPLLAAPRHHDFLAGSQVNEAAFPSGHATAAMALALAAVLVAPSAYRRYAALCGGAFALAVSFSIVTLGWHFPSDVARGLLVATTWCLASLAALRAAAARWPERTGREAARRALDPRHGRAVAGSLGMAAGASMIMLAPAAPQLVGYAERHTTTTAVAVALLGAAAVLLAAVTAVAARR